MNEINKYKKNEKINLYKENLIKFITDQKDKIIQIDSIDDLDYIIGILFLTETNRYCKQNKISIHGYYLAYSFINIFNKIKKKIHESYNFTIRDINHFIISLSKNIDYLNSRVNTTNLVKNKITSNLIKFQIDNMPIFIELCEYCKKHNDQIDNSNKFCDEDCNVCWTFILSKFFNLLLQTAKFLGSGIYNEANLQRISEYYANIFCILFKCKSNIFLNNINQYTEISEIYENYLNYKNKLNYSLIELELNSDTLNEIINYIDNEIVKKLSIKIK